MSVECNAKTSQIVVMATLTIELEDTLARYVEESAGRESKPVSAWVSERLRPDNGRNDHLAEMETCAAANDYPPGWLQLFGSLADDASFDAPRRSATRPAPGLDAA